MPSPKKKKKDAGIELRIPPQALESERAFLGALMVRPEGMAESVDVISADAFYSEKHSANFEVCILY